MDVFRLPWLLEVNHHVSYRSCHGAGISDFTQIQISYQVGFISNYIKVNMCCFSPPKLLISGYLHYPILFHARHSYYILIFVAGKTYPRFVKVIYISITFYILMISPLCPILISKLSSQKSQKTSHVLTLKKWAQKSQPRRSVQLRFPKFLCGPGFPRSPRWWFHPYLYID